MVVFVGLALLLGLAPQPTLVLRSGAILVPAVVDGNPVRLILDTGMPDTVIDPYYLAGRTTGTIPIQVPGSREFRYECDPKEQITIAPETWQNDRRLGAAGFLGLRQLKRMIVGLDLLTGEFNSWSAAYNQAQAEQWLRADHTTGQEEPEKLSLRTAKNYVYVSIKRAGHDSLPILDLGCDFSIDPADKTGDRGAPIAMTSAFFPIGETHSVTVFSGADYTCGSVAIRRLSSLGDRDFGGPLLGWHGFSGARMVLDIGAGLLSVRWRGQVSTPLTRSLARMGLILDLEGHVQVALGPSKAAGIEAGDTILSVNGGAVFAKDGGLEVAQSPDMALALDRNLYSVLMLKVKKQKSGKDVYMVVAPAKTS